jgi:hypothetical protein
MLEEVVRLDVTELEVLATLADEFVAVVLTCC